MKAAAPRTHEAVEVAEAEERLRQEVETFNQRQEQDRKFFKVKIAMGWAAVGLLILICLVATYVVIEHDDFETEIVRIAAATLFVETLGLMVSTWKLYLGKGPQELRPITRARADENEDGA